MKRRRVLIVVLAALIAATALGQETAKTSSPAPDGEIWYALTGAITPTAAHDLVVWTDSQIHSGGATRLKVLISSTGGDVDSAVRIYSYLKALPLEVETVGFGQVDSAANLAYLAGHRRTAVKHCRFFLHEGSFTIGNPTASLHAHEETLRLLQELMNQQLKILSAETGKTLDEVKRAVEQGTILTVEQARAFGIVHEILDKLPLRRQVAGERQGQPERK
jgi:ATP-dependent protease ClpP protease subunit